MYLTDEHEIIDDTVDKEIGSIPTNLRINVSTYRLLYYIRLHHPGIDDQGLAKQLELLDPIAAESHTVCNN